MCAETIGDFCFGDHFAVDPDALAKGDQVRGGEEAGAITVRAQMESIIAQTEPLPLVPATWMMRWSCRRDARARARSRWMFSRPSLMPKRCVP